MGQPGAQHSSLAFGRRPAAASPACPAQAPRPPPGKQACKSLSSLQVSHAAARSQIYNHLQPSLESDQWQLRLGPPAPLTSSGGAPS